MRKLWLLSAILVMSFGFAGCSDSAGPEELGPLPEELGPLTDSSIVFTGFTTNTTPFNKIYAVLPDGTGFRMLTTGAEESIHPRWSRDGEKIAWVLIILFLHFLGALIYFFVGRPRKSALTM